MRMREKNSGLEIPLSVGELFKDGSFLGTRAVYSLDELTGIRLEVLNGKRWLTFDYGERGGMQIRMCEKHYARLVKKKYMN